MILISAHTRGQLYAAIILKRYFYTTANVDIVLWGSMHDYNNIVTRVKSSLLFRNVFTVEPHSHSVPHALRFAWYQEFISFVPTYMQDKFLVGELKMNNEYMRLAFCEDTSEIYSARALIADKAFAYSPNLMSTKIRTHTLPTALLTADVSYVEHILGYYNPDIIRQADKLVITGRHPAILQEPSIFIPSTFATKNTIFMLEDSLTLHPFMGECLTVIPTVFPLPLLAANNVLDDKTLLVAEPMAVEHLGVAAAAGINIRIFTRLLKTSKEHLDLLDRLYGRYPNVKFMGSEGC